MAAPTMIGELVERFNNHLETYCSAEYNEAQLREEFLNPFFEALGWDVYNRKGYADAYKEVIHEAAIKVGGRTKAPDYCFRAGGGKASFFVEAKKPDVAEAVSPAYQLRRYAWSAKLPLSLLSDFATLAVYDCRIRPVKTDKAATARVLHFTYQEYLDRWDELHGLLSPEAVRRGALERFIGSKKVKKGTAEVDAAFLTEIETWRDVLARNIALRNERLEQRDLNFAVQRTLDRTIFLRICEDRGIEPYGTLQGLVNGTAVYRRLAELFQRADERYNSGLFHFTPEKDRAEPPDEFTLALTIDDKPLKDIVQALYYPESPYEFSVLPAEILGQVYEQFLGKVIRLTKGHQAKVEEKPEVRKAGGVYYTPAYIVEYIVEQTVGKLLEKKTPAQAAKLRILDPACGSGSFLIGAYQRLLDWHRDQYVAEDPEKHARGRNPRLYRGAAGEWRLTTAERKRILLNNVYGVDIDPQAVEVTKLSLLLKVLEGESKETVNNQLRLFHERALPDLGQNVKCGNSLIGPDFYQGRQKDLFNEEEIYRINAFDWKAEFPEILRRECRGFDAVVGNPPYGAVFHENEASYVSSNYRLAGQIPDAYVAFVEQAHRLLGEGAKFGFIIPSAWLGGPAYRALREFLLRVQIDSVVLPPFDVFKQAYIDTCLLATTKRAPSPQHAVVTYEYPKRAKLARIDVASLPVNLVSQTQWATAEDKKFVVSAGILDLLSAIRVRTQSVLGDVVEMKRGVLFDDRLLTRKKSSERSYRYFEGDVYRYRVNLVARSWVEFGDTMREFPREFKWFRGERLLLRRLVSRQQRLMASFFTETVITNKNLYTLRATAEVSNSYVLGLLNSRLLSRLYLSQVSQARKDDFPQVTIRDVLSLPIPRLDVASRSDRVRHDRMVELVEGMLSLHKRLAGVKNEHEKTLLKRQIETTDRQIDQLVHELYDLREDEIRLVEEATT